MNKDLKWLAENVHEWPKSAASARDSLRKTGFYWRGDFVIHEDGRQITRAQWQAARDELSGKPSWDEAPVHENHRCIMTPAVEPEQWRGPEDGLPPVGMRVKLHNDQGFFLDYMQSAIGEEVTVKAVFYSGDSNIPMAAVETDDKTCGCFRVAMIKPCKTEEDRAIEEMWDIISDEFNELDPCDIEIVRALYRAGYRKQEAE